MPENLDLALLLSVIGAHQNQRIEGRTRIQKIVCLLQRSAKIPFSFDFKPYYYGPYSDDLSDSINSLVGMKLVKETIKPTRYGSYRYDYELTEEGKILFHKTETKSKNVIDVISKEVKKYEDLSTPILVKTAKKVSGIPSIY